MQVMSQNLLRVRARHLSKTIFRSISLILVRAYQVILSPFLGGACRFEPTCSHYAVEVLNKQNPTKAVYLIFKRLLKCHPWGGHGYDPSPEERSLTS